MKQYMRHKDGTYVAFDMRQQSKEMLDHFVEMNLGLDERIDPKTYHTTIIYSRSPVPEAEQFNGMEIETMASVTGYEVFPTKTGEKCLVMRLSFPLAEKLNSILTRFGATSDYSEYKAHVTISYGYTGPEDTSNLPLPQFDLWFDKIDVAPLDVEFVPGNKED